MQYCTYSIYTAQYLHILVFCLCQCGGADCGVGYMMWGMVVSSAGGGAWWWCRYRSCCVGADSRNAGCDVGGGDMVVLFVLLVSVAIVSVVVLVMFMMFWPWWLRLRWRYWSCWWHWNCGFCDGDGCIGCSIKSGYDRALPTVFLEVVSAGDNDSSGGAALIKKKTKFSLYIRKSRRERYQWLTASSYMYDKIFAHFLIY
jgi:hypothetical protein